MPCDTNNKKLYLLLMVVTAVMLIAFSSCKKNQEQTASRRECSQMSKEVIELDVTVMNALRISINGEIVDGIVLATDSGFYIPTRLIAIFNYYDYKVAYNTVYLHSHDNSERTQEQFFHSLSGMRFSPYTITSVFRQNKDACILVLHPQLGHVPLESEPNLELKYGTKYGEYEVGENVWAIWGESLHLGLRIVYYYTYDIRKYSDIIDKVIVEEKIMVIDDEIYNIELVEYKDELYILLQDTSIIADSPVAVVDYKGEYVITDTK